MGRPVRLACLRHAASVYPEPGSNSSFDWLFIFYSFFRVFLTYLLDVRLYFVFFSCSVFKELSHVPLETCSMILSSFRFYVNYFLHLFLSLWLTSTAYLIYGIFFLLARFFYFFSSLKCLLKEIYKKRRRSLFLLFTRQRAWFTFRLFSPLQCLTSVFGMGTGISTALSSPDSSFSSGCSLKTE